jgi:hypothetical protein
VTKGWHRLPKLSVLGQHYTPATSEKALRNLGISNTNRSLLCLVMIVDSVFFL